MLFVLRVIFGAALAWGVFGAMKNADQNPESGDIANAGYLALCVILGIANAIVWAPFFGSRVSDMMTGSMTDSTFVDRRNYLLRMIYWCQAHGWKRITVRLCFLEGIRNPNLPTPFIIGLKNARPGSWLEKIYAKEVFRFENAQNCILAFHILMRHGIDPRPHHSPQVILALQGIDREVKPDPEKLIVPKAEAPVLKRNPKIQLHSDQPKDKPQPE
jgi:hypothetical protein